MLGICLLLAGQVLASGEIDKENWFEPQYQVHPAELIDFATKNPGVVQGGYWRIYLFLAYRSLIGAPLQAEQVKKLEVYRWHIAYTAEWPDTDPVEVWMQARQEMPETAPVKIDRYRSLGLQNYLNCGQDAFLKAAETLKDRRQWGDQWAGEWLKGQDAVFANCSGGETLILPPELPAQAPSWLQADRRYQRAAALFYGGLFDQARDLFLAIAEDRDNPWSPLGVYLAARALTRKASLACTDINDFFTEAEGECRQDLIEAEMDLSPLLPSSAAARSLYGWLRIRSAPYERFDELANFLASQELPAEYQQLLVDYLLMFDHFPAERIGGSTARLTQWIGAMQASVIPEEREAALFSARSLRQRYGGEEWLIPLLLAARKGELTPDELQAARAVAETSPAYLTVRYALARMMIEKGQHDEARRIVDEVIRQHGGKFAPSTRNRFASLQLQLAESPDAFFAAAPRAYLKLNTTGLEEFEEPDKASDFFVTYNNDALVALNVWTPLDILKRFATRKDLPGELAKMLPEAVWTRAVLLGDFATADEMTGLLPPPPTDDEPLWQRYKNAVKTSDKKTAASLILINTPQFRPYIESVRDKYSHYWWCDLAGEDYAKESAAPPLFLSEEEKARAKKEQALLARLPNGTDYLAPLLLARARAVPDDPEIPRALHLLVQATKGGCISKKTSSYSRDAFRLLHKKYPGNEWTELTPYHY